MHGVVSDKLFVIIIQHQEFGQIFARAENGRKEGHRGVILQDLRKARPTFVRK
jgi:hypothetical protein